MRGPHRIVVQNKRLRYDFEIRRNLTMIQGNSATGKTTLIEMIQEYYENGLASGIEIHADKECAILSGRKWKTDLTVIQDSIVFIDEGNEFVFSDEFSDVIQNTDNYYVIVTREGIPSLPYSVEEIYGIRNSGKYGTLKRTYNEFFHLYRVNELKAIETPQIVITEDSNSGYEFFQTVTDKRDMFCKSAEGKSNIFFEAVKIFADAPDTRVLVIGDGAAFGSEMEKMYRLMEQNENLNLYLPESFEWLILKSGVIEDREITEMLAAPEEQIDSQKYFSWERFFTVFLINKTEKTYLKYKKRSLNPAYLNDKIQKKILAVIAKAGELF